MLFETLASIYGNAESSVEFSKPLAQVYGEWFQTFKSWVSNADLEAPVCQKLYNQAKDIYNFAVEKGVLDKDVSWVQFCLAQSIPLSPKAKCVDDFIIDYQKKYVGYRIAMKGDSPREEATAASAQLKQLLEACVASLMKIDNAKEAQMPEYRELVMEHLTSESIPLPAALVDTENYYQFIGERNKCEGLVQQLQDLLAQKCEPGKVGTLLRFSDVSVSESIVSANRYLDSAKVDMATAPDFSALKAGLDAFRKGLETMAQAFPPEKTSTKEGRVLLSFLKEAIPRTEALIASAAGVAMREEGGAKLRH